MKSIRNERGIALITALMLSFLALVIILALMYLISRGTAVSAANKRYKNALEASYGGAEVFTKDILPQLMGGVSPTDLTSVLAGALYIRDDDCTDSKMLSAPSQWLCSAASKSLDPKNEPDATFKLRGQPIPGLSNTDFNIYAKIVDTQPGNSDTSGVDFLDSAAGVAYGVSGVSPMHMPATYRIEVQGERETNPQEKAKLSVLYVY